MHIYMFSLQKWAQKCIVFPYKIPLPTTGLACIMQCFQSVSQICANVDRFDNFVIYTQNFSIFCSYLLCKHTLSVPHSFTAQKNLNHLLYKPKHILVFSAGKCCINVQICLQKLNNLILNIAYRSALSQQKHGKHYLTLLASVMINA